MTPSRASVALGWAGVGISILVLLVFGAIRLSEMRHAPAGDRFAERYVEHPVVALAHMVPGFVFIILAPMQFVPALRRRRLGLHRGMGRLLIPCGLVSGVFAFGAAFRLPAFGGLATQTATVFFGVIFVFSLIKAFVHIKRRQVAAHREWMIRAFALALGVASIRLFIGLAQALTEITFEQAFGPAFWLGLAVNLLLAEVWIQHTRPAERA